MPNFAPDGDDTVLIRQPALRRIRPAMLAAGLAAVAVLAGGALWRARLHTHAELPVQTEASVDFHAACETHVTRLEQDRDIVIISFATLLAQGQALNRVAAFVEKAGLPHARVLDDTALAAAIRNSGASVQTYYYGHDYQAADLRRFFAQAARESIDLNPQEMWLRRLLAGMGWLQADAPGAIITLSASGAMLDGGMRAVILRHEIAHGAFFTVPAYRDYTEHFWQALPATERAGFVAFLGSEGYDTGLEALMFNEMQAYLAFTPDGRFFNAQAVGLSDTRLETLRAAFLNGMPNFWLRHLAAQPLPPASIAACPGLADIDPA
ncbi:hypothetical protein GLUCOINTEAF2_0202635 [Komagataeibacter intermedius AF2]|uniref:Uncharacterized protein n=1 Tax=Komagataeibacter intermedius AF2 TaxID=1458464 RepID=A0A0N0MFB7_9PROT|nr:hypothetical protein [Komagataeibacter intermedius]KPH86584.1 hypothetical protein GLUCOINTEAF2_0202635 [Komagataeibacter intermedius AF2]